MVKRCEGRELGPGWWDRHSCLSLRVDRKECLSYQGSIDELSSAVLPIIAFPLWLQGGHDAKE